MRARLPRHGGHALPSIPAADLLLVISMVHRLTYPTSPQPAHLHTSMKLRPIDERAFIIVVTVRRPPRNSLVWPRMVWRRAQHNSEQQNNTNSESISSLHARACNFNLFSPLCYPMSLTSPGASQMMRSLGAMFSSTVPVRLIHSPASSASFGVPHTRATIDALY